MRGKQRLLVILTPIIAIALALLVGAVIIAALGKDPIRGYFMLFYGSLGSPQKIAQSLVTACPLIFTSLAAAFAYKCGVYNLGGEGQFIMGAVAAAAFCALTGVEGVAGTLGALAVGAAVGAAWGALPGVMKISRGLNEMITSIMLNYVATLFMGFVYTTALRDGTTPQTPAVAESVQLARMSDVFRIHPGVIIAVALAFVLYYVVFRTSFGFKIRAVGMNAEAARVNGFPVRRLVMLAFVISGAIAGLGGSELVFQPGFVVVNGGAAVRLLLLVILEQTVELLHFGEVLVRIEGAERLDNLLRRRHDALDVLVEDGAQRVERLETHRVGHGDRQDAIGLPQRDDAEFPRQIAGQKIADVIAEREPGDVVELHVERGGKHAQHVVFREDSRFDQIGNGGNPLLGSFERGGVGRVWIDLVVFQKNLQYVFVVGGHGRKSGMNRINKGSAVRDLSGRRRRRESIVMDIVTKTGGPNK